MQQVGLLTFNAWALDGYLKVFWRNAAAVAAVAAGARPHHADAAFSWLRAFARPAVGRQRRPGLSAGVQESATIAKPAPSKIPQCDDWLRRESWRSAWCWLLGAATWRSSANTYATLAEARAAGAVERGWLPPLLPAGAHDIREAHDEAEVAGGGDSSVFGRKMRTVRSKPGGPSGASRGSARTPRRESSGGRCSCGGSWTPSGWRPPGSRSTRSRGTNWWRR